MVHVILLLWVRAVKSAQQTTLLRLIWQEVRHIHSIEEVCESRWRKGLYILYLQVIRNYADERELMSMVNELLGIIENKEEKIMFTMKIEGMMCPHCQAAVTKALNGVEGVTEANVSLEEKAAYVTTNGQVSGETLKKVVTDAGYEVRSVEE